MQYPVKAWMSNGHAFCITTLVSVPYLVPLLNIGDNQPKGESERIVDSDVLIYTFYFDIGGHFTRFDGYGIGKNPVMFPSTALLSLSTTSMANVRS